MRRGWLAVPAVVAATVLAGCGTSPGSGSGAGGAGARPPGGLSGTVTVFASASTKNMDSVVRSGAASGPTTFAKNAVEIAVPPANPGGVTSLADLAKPGLKIALCQPQAPCGATAQQVFDNAKIAVKPVTLGADVKAVLAAVQLGEVDAGVVYRTDVRAAGAKVTGIGIPAEQNASTSYPIAALTRAPNAAAARAFVDYVLSAAGTKVLTEAGFAKP